MSTAVRAQLVKLGWQEGDPIPGDLSLRLKEITDEFANDTQAASEQLHADSKTRIKPKIELVDIDTLPPARQAELRQYMQEHKAATAAAAQARTDTAQHRQAEAAAGVPQAVSAGLSGLASVAARQRAGRSFEFVDDTSVSAPPPGPQVPEGKTFAGTSGQPLIAEKLSKLSGEKTEATLPPQPPDPTADDIGATPLPPEHCPRCNYRVAAPLTVTPTEEDKQLFMASNLDPRGQTRFTKRYTLLGGKMAVTFRGLSVNEVVAVNYQLGQEVRDSKIAGDGEYLTTLMDYRFVLSVWRLESGGHISVDSPTLLGFKTESPGLAGTGLPEFRNQFYNEAVSNETMRHMLGKLHREFQRLTEHLEAMGDDESFYNGIEPHG